MIDQPTPRTEKTPAIAVIGLGLQYPGAGDARTMWENILGRRRQFREMIDERLPLKDYYDPDPAAPDKTYGYRAAYLDNFEFDWKSRRVPEKSYDSTDIVHWLALEVAIRAVADWGHDRKSVPNQRSGVIVGNTLTGEQVRSTSMRLRWPFVRRVLMTSAMAKGATEQAANEFCDVVEPVYKSAFAPVTEDTLAGGLSNTIAGRICNFFDFDGGGYTVDGACSSSLIAVATAANALASGDMDLALAGGVDISLDTFELIGFAKTGALTQTDMTVYDKRGDGFIPGEGCGFVVLKRMEDAIRDGDYVYAKLAGWGVSTDGRGGITAPSKVGQSKALTRAYERAGYSPHTVDFIEGHGTGTAVGDRAELDGVAIALQNFGIAPDCTLGITSLKSLVGHTKAAAGIAGFLKTVMAVNQRVIPPTAKCEIPHPAFEDSARSIYPVNTGEVRDPSDEIRAGVSAMGFGGINSHCTLTSADPPHPGLRSELHVRALLASSQDAELIPLAAESVDRLIEAASELASKAHGIAAAEVADLASQTSLDLRQDLPCRAAVIASSPNHLQEALSQLIEFLRTSPTGGQVHSSPRGDWWFANNVHGQKVGFLFPGQGSQQLNMARFLVERFPWAAELVENADKWLEEVGLPRVSPSFLSNIDAKSENDKKTMASTLSQTEIAQPAICLASILWFKFLTRIGMSADALGGHSLGELTAFHAAGLFDERTLIQMAGLRGQVMSQESEAGTMLMLATEASIAEKLISQAEGYAVVANLNSPTQTVVSGSESAIEQIERLAADQKVESRRLPVSNAFHSDLVASASSQFRERARFPSTGNNSANLFTSTDGQKVAASIDLNGHFSEQITSKVDFVELQKQMVAHCDHIVEVGPGRVLSGLVSSCNDGVSVCLPVASQATRFRDLCTIIARWFVSGGKPDFQEFYAHRLIRPFQRKSERTFIGNQCERPLDTHHLQNGPNLFSSSNGAAVSNGAVIGELFSADELAVYFAQRSDYLAKIIQLDIETLPNNNPPPLDQA